MEPTLIETFKDYYFDYRAVADADTSFEDALSALTFAVVERTGDYAEAGDLDSIRNLVREFREIRLSTQGSNDSVKERFEREFALRSGRTEETPLH
ncbi:hypothetical protein [Paenibacillus flagellatus]|uniref:Uncharacterized protein n=1 Tax=Paenibacillus flagellatus TaxID=2211139 RepID=A0A2V5KDZ1_9BACL|nr:hypothetical protein [Paenibacillus flagellatus]PYI56504.1 hypothetical protein DLM86_05900 [Paenibacillus flagellatus]